MQSTPREPWRFQDNPRWQNDLGAKVGGSAATNGQSGTYKRMKEAMQPAFSSDEMLVEELARRVLAWKPAPGRFIKPGPGRRWTPRWKFQPLTRLEDAVLLVDRAADAYRFAGGCDSTFSATVRVGRNVGEASGEPKARAITLALARGLGLILDPERAKQSNRSTPARSCESTTAKPSPANKPPSPLRRPRP